MSDLGGERSAVLIAHALGEVEGVTYTNSDAAFRHSIASGFRVLEADLALTRDREVVLYHHKRPAVESETGWREKKAHQLSWEMLSQKRYLGRYPVLDLQAFVKLVREFPEAKIVLDIKTISKSRVLRARGDDEIGLFNALALKFYKKQGREVGAAGERLFRFFGWSLSNRHQPHGEIVARLVSMCEAALLDRMIPQVGKDSVRLVDELYPFPMRIWKPTGERIDKAFMLAEQNHCPYISLHEKKVSVQEIRLSQRHNVKILVYGTESSDRISELVNVGVSGFYLDKMYDLESAPI